MSPVLGGASIALLASLEIRADTSCAERPKAHDVLAVAWRSNEKPNPNAAGGSSGRRRRV